MKRIITTLIISIMIVTTASYSYGSSFVPDGHAEVKIECKKSKLVTDTLHDEMILPKNINYPPAAIVDEPVIRVDALDFGKVKVGNMTVKIFKIYNQGTIDLAVTGFTNPSTPFFPGFSLMNPEIISHSSTDFYITVICTAAGIFRDSIVFSSNAVKIDSVLELQCECVGPNSIEEEALNPELLLYPNPATGSQATLRIDSPVECPASVTLFNSLGLAMGNIFTGSLQQGANSIPIDMYSLPSGIYYLQIDYGNRIEIVKFSNIR